MKETKNTLKAIDFKVEERKGNAFLLTGDDAYWRDYVVEKLLSLLSETEREFNYRSFSDIKSIEEAESAFTSMGFFGGINIVAISGYGAKKTQAKAESKASDKEKHIFEDILLNLNEGTILVVYNSNVPLSLKKYFVEVDCAKLDAPTLRSYIPKLVAPKKIDGNALYTLVEYCGRDMAQISNEILKLKAYMGAKQVITLEMVETLVANTVENEIFELANAIAEKNKLKAVTLFDRFVARGIDFSFILASLIGQYRRLLHCALSKKSDAELAEALKIKEFAVKKSRETASKYGKATLKSCLDELVDAEFNFKSGVMLDETAVRTAMAKLIAK
ncbi:MAG: DNA polymerase III subunit delta [Clostridia bacterium]|nr:DNA polymerase III subunit delta [Clostridia bacterium]